MVSTTVRPLSSDNKPPLYVCAIAFIPQHDLVITQVSFGVEIVGIMDLQQSPEMP
jgi:hypothetical protein